MAYQKILVHEFGDGIGFYASQGRIKVKLYDTNGSSSYIEAVISLLGIDNDQLIQNAAKMQKRRLEKQEYFPGHPRLGSLSRRKMLPLF